MKLLDVLALLLFFVAWLVAFLATYTLISVNNVVFHGYLASFIAAFSVIFAGLYTYKGVMEQIQFQKDLEEDAKQANFEKVYKSETENLKINMERVMVLLKCTRRCLSLYKNYSSHVEKYGRENWLKQLDISIARLKLTLKKLTNLFEREEMPLQLKSAFRVVNDDIEYLILVLESEIVPVRDGIGLKVADIEGMFVSLDSESQTVQWFHDLWCEILVDRRKRLTN